MSGQDIYFQISDCMEVESEDDDGLSVERVVCRNCEAAAYSSWSFCRSCEEPLEDPLPPEEVDFAVEDAPAVDGEEGCPKCGHDSATVDDVATTGTGVTRLLDLQNRTFTAVVCDRCGYTEFYNQRTRDRVILDLFFG